MSTTTISRVCCSPPKSYPQAALLTIDPVAAFEDFLKSFKSTAVTEADARDALSNLNMDDDDEEVEMNDTPGRRTTRSGGARARPRRPKAAAPELKIKYMVQLQEVSNRERDSVTLELDDLREVGPPPSPAPSREMMLWC